MTLHWGEWRKTNNSKNNNSNGKDNSNGNSKNNGKSWLGEGIPSRLSDDTTVAKMGIQASGLITGKQFAFRANTPP